MSAVSQDTAVRTGRVTRAFIYLVLLLFALFYLLPLYVMGVNSVKPLSEITGGNMMSLPNEWTLDPWRSAWSTAQIGVQATGLKPYFLTSILMVMNMGATLFRLTVAECLLAVTANAASALGLSAETGCLRPGLSADLALWDVTRPAQLVARIGFNPLHARIFQGDLQ